MTTSLKQAIGAALKDSDFDMVPWSDKAVSELVDAVIDAFQRAYVLQDCRYRAKDWELIN